MKAWRRSREGAVETVDARCEHGETPCFRARETVLMVTAEILLAVYLTPTLDYNEEC